jgi:hypothetical protein
MREIPPPADALWSKLVNGRVTHKFKLFAANMALAGAVRHVAENPACKAAAIEEFHRFCSKYADLVADDLQVLR